MPFLLQLPHELSCPLRHPVGCWVRGTANEMNSARTDLNEERNIDRFQASRRIPTKICACLLETKESPGLSSPSAKLYSEPTQSTVDVQQSWVSLIFCCSRDSVFIQLPPSTSFIFRTHILSSQDREQRESKTKCIRGGS